MWLVGGTQDSFTWGLRGPTLRLLREVAKRPVCTQRRCPWSSSLFLGISSSGFCRRRWAARLSGGQVSASFPWMSLLLPQSTEARVCVHRRPDWCVCCREGSCHSPESLPGTSWLSLLIAEGESICWELVGVSVRCNWQSPSAGKESTCNAGDLGLIPGLGRSPGEGNVYPLQYSGLENSMDYIVHGVTKSQTRLSTFHFHFCSTSKEGAIYIQGVLILLVYVLNFWNVSRCAKWGENITDG